MKTITLWQPWASLIALGIKNYETRSWPASVKFQGEIGIHAAKKIIPFDQIFYDLPVKQRLEIMQAICQKYGDYSKLPTGVIIAKTNLTGVFHTEKIRDSLSLIERACGDYSDGRYAWMLKNTVAYENPIPAVGKQGFWDWEPPEEVQA